MRDQASDITGTLAAADAEEDSHLPNMPYVMPVFTNAAYEAERDLTKPAPYMPASRPWLAPLLDAIGSPVFPDSDRKNALWQTSWGQDGKEDSSPEHAAYLAYVKAFAWRRMPWLLSLLDGARAIVAVSPGTFAFVVDNYQGEVFDIPELTPYTHLVPWATDEERKAGH